MLPLIAAAVVGGIIYCANKKKADAVEANTVSTPAATVVDTSLADNIAKPVSGIRRSIISTTGRNIAKPQPGERAQPKLLYSSTSTAAPNATIATPLIPQTSRFQRIA